MQVQGGRLDVAAAIEVTFVLEPSTGDTVLE
jgi:hypothetical protein